MGRNERRSEINIGPPRKPLACLPQAGFLTSLHPGPDRSYLPTRGNYSPRFAGEAGRFPDPLLVQFFLLRSKIHYTNCAVYFTFVRVGRIELPFPACPVKFSELYGAYPVTLQRLPALCVRTGRIELSPSAWPRPNFACLCGIRESNPCLNLGKVVFCH